MQPAPLSRARLMALTLAALGVVYGDIGTSPLYAVKECFNPKHGAPPTPENVLGVMSLIIWSLLLIVTVKYLVFVVRADNRGEGGILALLALAFPERSGEAAGRRLTRWMIGFGMAGACLLYGDGIITPAISVLGAVEGLAVATPAFDDYILPVSVVILIGLFLAQSAGTASVGRIFGPITLVWFSTIGVIGLGGLIQEPGVLAAVNPWWGAKFLATHGWMGLHVLGSVVLVVTGGEALYADMGHFGRKPIRLAWYSVVLPGLLLSYLGQGALVMGHPELVNADNFNPFYMLCPRWALYPMVVLATAAAVIASQALISGAYSLTMHAIQLGYMPRLIIEHTSERERGQIYMPQVNWAMMLACVALVLGFQTSGALAAAYGVAVTLTMATTTVLFYFAARRVFQWSHAQALALTVLALAVELPFVFANLLKVPHGGWFPLVVAGAIFTLMATWRRGRRILWERIRGTALPVEQFLASVERRQLERVPGTAVYLAGTANGVPVALLHNLKHNKVLHERVIFFTVAIAEEPRVDDDSRLSVEDLGHNFWRVRAVYGFMEEPDVPDVLRRCHDLGLKFREHETSFFVSRETIIPSRKSGMAGWREKLFAIMARNAHSATAFFRLPANRVVELGMQVEI